MTDAALALYMLDYHLMSRSELYRSAVGQLLEREGYLVRSKDGYELAKPERDYSHIEFVW